MEKRTCPICGKPTRIYMGNARKDGLCGEHADKLKSGELLYCEKCNTYHEKNQHCKCYNHQNQIKDNNNNLTCLICGANSNGKHFCLSCWKKYKDKSIDLRITNCDIVTILDSYGNRKHKTHDGRFVRSMSEKIIIDYFFDEHIRVVYEKTIPYIDKNGKEKELHPDFYLPDYDLYIEFNGLSNKDYLKSKDYVSKIYKEKNYQLAILESQDLEDCDKSIGNLLLRYKKNN